MRPTRPNDEVNLSYIVTLVTLWVLAASYECDVPSK